MAVPRPGAGLVIALGLFAGLLTGCTASATSGDDGS